MGQLYLALAGTPGLQKLCVIKQVPPDVIAPENARRFRDEAMVVLRLAHGNLVPVFDAGIHGGEIFLAMEYVDGRDLHAVWNRCAERRMPFPVDVAAYVVKELVPRSRLRPQLREPGAGPPRRLARQRAAVFLGRGEADRLRPGDVGAEAGKDRARDHLRQGQLPRPRAGPARAARRPGRSLLGRHPAVGALDRAAALPAAHRRRHGGLPFGRQLPSASGAPATPSHAARRSCRTGCRPSWSHRACGRWPPTARIATPTAR